MKLASAIIAIIFGGFVLIPALVLSYYVIVAIGVPMVWFYLIFAGVGLVLLVSLLDSSKPVLGAARIVGSIPEYVIIYYMFIFVGCPVGWFVVLMCGIGIASFINMFE